jgi:hypothetical protein
MGYLFRNHPFQFMSNLKILGVVLFFIIGVGSGIWVASGSPKLWDLNLLNKAPEIKWLVHEGPVYSLEYQGLPYKGKNTRVFAYYATPGSLKGNPALDKDLPGVILIHAGKGHAAASWVISWAKFGYAALSMDL